MAFIDTIPDSEISADVQAMYERQKSFWGFVPNYARVFCYRPEIMWSVGAAAGRHQEQHGQTALRADHLRRGAYAAQHAVLAGAWQGVDAVLFAVKTSS